MAINGSSSWFNFKLRRLRVYLGVIGDVNKVDDVSCGWLESDVGHGVRFLGDWDIFLDRKFTIESIRVSVGDDDGDGVGIVLAIRPSDGV